MGLPMSNWTSFIRIRWDEHKLESVQWSEYNVSKDLSAFRGTFNTNPIWKFLKLTAISKFFKKWIDELILVLFLFLFV